MRPSALEVEYDGVVTTLEPRVMQVLVALHRSAGEPVSRDALINACWSGRVVTDGALNRCVGRVRKALARNPRVRVETISKVGYRMRLLPVGDAPTATAPCMTTSQPATSERCLPDAQAAAAMRIRIVDATYDERSAAATGPLCGRSLEHTPAVIAGVPIIATASRDDPAPLFRSGDDPIQSASLWRSPENHMAWILLVIAGLFEIGWAIGLKFTDGFTRFWPSVATAASMIISVVLLAWAMRTLPVGTAYAVWTGLGAVGTVALGIVLFNEPATLMRLGCVALIAAGILGLKFSA